MYERPEEYAKYWVEQAIRFYKSVGRDVALAEFSNPNGMFVQNELYVFVLSLNGDDACAWSQRKIRGAGF